ncbi:MAG TPA: histidine phosphatase family protein [Aeromicrobium sp.]|nr:histidine phosphatase family protein [Aeromicrobium sp.]
MGRGYRADRTLVLIRHAKSDWSANAADLERPLNGRGQRQAPESGRWIAANLEPIDRAVVSPAQRARSTWELVAAELADPPPVSVDERVYTFEGRGLLPVVRGFDDSESVVALVGHNPAMEDFVELLTGSLIAMPTSCVAVIGWSGSWAEAGSGGRLLAHGRPPG